MCNVADFPAVVLKDFSAVASGLMLIALLLERHYPEDIREDMPTRHFRRLSTYLKIFLQMASF